MIRHRRIVELSVKDVRVDAGDQFMHRRNHIAVRGADYQLLRHLRSAIVVRRRCKRIELPEAQEVECRKPHRFSPAIDAESKHISFSDPFRSLTCRNGNAKLAF